VWIFYSCFSLRRICAKRFSPDTTRQVAPCLHPIGAVDRFRFRISYYIVAFFCARITELWLDVGFPSPSLIGWAAPQLLRRYLGLQISRSLAPSLVVPAPRLHGEQEIMGNRIRNRGGLLLLDKYKHGFVWEWNSICHCRFILSFFSCMPCFLHWCLRLGFVLHGTCQGKATRIPRSTMDHWTLGTSIQMLSSYFVSPFSVHRHVYDAPVSDRVVQVLLAVVKFMTLQWSNFELGKGMAANYFTPHNMYVMLMTMTHHLWKIRWCESRSVQGWKIKSALL